MAGTLLPSRKRSAITGNMSPPNLFVTYASYSCIDQRCSNLNSDFASNGRALLPIWCSSGSELRSVQQVLFAEASRLYCSTFVSIRAVSCGGESSVILGPRTHKNNHLSEKRLKLQKNFLKFLREFILMRIHAAPVLAPTQIQENIFEELFMYWFRAGGVSSCFVACLVSKGSCIAVAQTPWRSEGASGGTSRRQRLQLHKFPVLLQARSWQETKSSSSFSWRWQKSRNKNQPE